MDERAHYWVGGISAFLTFAWVWAGLWTSYGIWGAVFGWIPGLILGAIVGAIAFWAAPFILGLLVLAAVGIGYVILTNR